VFPVFGDSAHHQPKFEPQSFKDIGTLTEAVWIMQNEADSVEVLRILQPFVDLAKRQFSLVNYVSDCNLESAIESKVVKQRIDDYLAAWEELNLTAHLTNRLRGLLGEVKEILEFVDDGDLEKVQHYIAKAKYLFQGANGVRHVDYIAYKRA
jgi:hypothetical protein